MLEKIEWYKEVLELEPNSRVFFPLAKMLAETENYDEAVKTLEKGLERHPEFLEARLFLIELLFTHNKKTACNQQVRELSHMFASYAGFWQAWAACLAQEPSEEDAASLLRFLAANFISGPLKLHDVINRGLQAIIEERSSSRSPEKQTEAAAASLLLEQSSDMVKEDSQKTENPGIEEVASQAGFTLAAADLAAGDIEAAAASDVPAEGFGQETAGDALESAETGILDDMENEIPETPIQAIAMAVSSPETHAGSDEGMAQAGEADLDYLPQDVIEAEEAIIMAQAGNNVETHGGMSLEESKMEQFPEIPDSPVEVDDSVPGFLTRPGLAVNDALADDADAIADLEGIPLGNKDIPEVPDLDAQGEYATLMETYIPAGNNLRTGEDAFNALIDDLATQSQNLSVANQETTTESMQEIDLPESFGESMATLGTDTTELDEIFDAGEAESPLIASEEIGKENFVAEEKEETISLRTKSMADVLAEQGDIQGALDIYHELAATAATEEEADEFRKRVATLEAALEVPEAAINDIVSGQESKHLIGMLEALAKRVEARAS